MLVVAGADDDGALGLLCWHWQWRDGVDAVTSFLPAHLSFIEYLPAAANARRGEEKRGERQSLPVDVAWRGCVRAKGRELALAVAVPLPVTEDS